MNISDELATLAASLSVALDSVRALDARLRLTDGVNEEADIYLNSEEVAQRCFGGAVSARWVERNLMSLRRKLSPRRHLYALKEVEAWKVAKAWGLAPADEVEYAVAS